MIEQYNGVQMDKAFQLASLNKGVKIIGDILEYREEGVDLPIARGNKETVFVDQQFFKGMKRCLTTLYFDLVDGDMQGEAEDILRHFK